MANLQRNLLAASFILSVFSTPAYCSPVKKIGQIFHGVASFYADKFNGKKTASGELFDNSKLTCAHRTLPFGTRILVKNPDTGSCCEVIVNDRGPYAHNRVVDLSKAAARKLGITGLGKVVCYAGKEVGKDVVQVLDSPSKLFVAKKDGVTVIGSSPPVIKTVNDVSGLPTLADKTVVQEVLKERAD